MIFKKHPIKISYASKTKKPIGDALKLFAYSGLFPRLFYSLRYFSNILPITILSKKACRLSNVGVQS
jgi:hypothetical protein